MKNQMNHYMRSSELLAFVSVALTGSLVIWRLMIGEGTTLWAVAVLIGVGLYYFETHSHLRLVLRHPDMRITPDIFTLGPLALSIVLSGLFFGTVTFLLSLELLFSLNYKNPFKPELYGCVIFLISLAAFITGIKAYKGMQQPNV